MDGMEDGMEDVEHALSQGARYDEAVVVEEKTVPLEHPVSQLPIGAALGGVVGHTAPERQDHARVF